MNELVRNASPAPSQTWLFFSLITVVCWGLYGAFLHSGQTAMHDPVNGRYKAFLFVGVAYFVTAVVAPLVLLLSKGASWNLTAGGIGWSFLAGIVGAAGAFGVLLAFGARGTPAVVMSIVFAGAPVLNALYTLALHPPAAGWRSIPWPFILGLILAALGGSLVTLYKPAPGPAPHQVTAPAKPLAGSSSAGAIPQT